MREGGGKRGKRKEEGGVVSGFWVKEPQPLFLHPSLPPFYFFPISAPHLPKPLHPLSIPDQLFPVLCLSLLIILPQRCLLLFYFPLLSPSFAILESFVMVLLFSPLVLPLFTSLGGTTFCVLFCPVDMIIQSTSQQHKSVCHSQPSNSTIVLLPERHTTPTSHPASIFISN